MPEWKKNWMEKKRMEERAKKKDKEVFDYDNFKPAQKKKEKNGYQKPQPPKKSEIEATPEDLRPESQPENPEEGRVDLFESE